MNRIPLLVFQAFMALCSQTGLADPSSLPAVDRIVFQSSETLKASEQVRVRMRELDVRPFLIKSDTKNVSRDRNMVVIQPSSAYRLTFEVRNDKDWRPVGWAQWTCYTGLYGASPVPAVIADAVIERDRLHFIVRSSNETKLWSISTKDVGDKEINWKDSEVQTLEASTDRANIQKIHYVRDEESKLMLESIEVINHLMDTAVVKYRMNKDIHVDGEVMLFSKIETPKRLPAPSTTRAANFGG